MGNIRTILTDDHAIFLDGLEKLLSDTKTFDIVGKFNNGFDLLEKITTLQPELLILDIEMPGITGLEVVRRIRLRNEKMKILILSMHDEIGYSLEASNLGANGLVLKSTETNRLVEIINSVLSGINYFSKVSSITKSVRLLSDREIEILKLLSFGLNNETISQKLKISTLTIKTHRKNIQKKLQAENSLQMIRIAFEKGLI